MLTTATAWCQLWEEDPFPSPLMPPTGATTLQVCSTTVQPNSTTVSFLLVFQLMVLGKSRTPGEPAGEKEVSLDFTVETHAVSAMLPHIPTNEPINDYLGFHLCYSLSLRR